MPAMKRRQPLAAHDVKSRRSRTADTFGALINTSPTYPDIVQEDISIKSYDGAEITVIRVRLQQGTVHPDHSASCPSPRTPAIIHAHGGGMIVGDAKVFVKALGTLVHRTGIQFFSVDYRVAPEHQHPTLVEDCWSAVKYVSDNAEALSVDPARIAVYGESAGGGIAAGVAIMARDRAADLRFPLAKQILIYPMLDDRNDQAVEHVEPLAIWKVDDNITGWTALLGENAGGSDHGGIPNLHYAVPARVPSVAGLPPTYIDVGELDIFKTEDMEYALRLSNAGVSTEFHLYPGVPHAFDVLAPNISVVQRAMENRIRAMTSF